jgi:uncharacterized oxidoreductase
MKTFGNTILITGGGTGIGLAMAEVFLREGNQVLLCGRRKDRLLAGQSKFPKIQFRVCNLAEVGERQALFEWATSNYPDLNIQVNFSAPVQLSAIFIPYLMKQSQSAIINVSSGLGFIPLTILPVYCATKAAIHSFSLSLQHQLRKTNVKVFEVKIGRASCRERVY